MEFRAPSTLVEEFLALSVWRNRQDVKVTGLALKSIFPSDDETADAVEVHRLSGDFVEFA